MARSLLSTPIQNLVRVPRALQNDKHRTPPPPQKKKKNPFFLHTSPHISPPPTGAYIKSVTNWWPLASFVRPGGLIDYKDSTINCKYYNQFNNVPSSSAIEIKDQNTTKRVILTTTKKYPCVQIHNISLLRFNYIILPILLG